MHVRRKRDRKKTAERAQEKEEEVRLIMCTTARGLDHPSRVLALGAGELAQENTLARTIDALSTT
ncbi:MAG: hypothetical protein ABI646_05115, partial [Acidobacteriota bacterium]